MSPPETRPGPRKPAGPPGVLRFSPTAWAKLLYFRDRGPTEIGGFGITPEDDLLYVRDFLTVRQGATAASIAFEDGAVADFFDRQVDGGLKPMQFARVWCHTHPGNCPSPSSIDEGTFGRVFGTCQHAIMFILAEGGQSYARLRFNVGPAGSIVLPVQVDYGRPFGSSDVAAWEAEYLANIHAESSFTSWMEGGDLLEGPDKGDGQGSTSALFGIPDDWMADLDRVEPSDRRAILDELGQGDPWEQEVAAHGR